MAEQIVNQTGFSCGTEKKESSKSIVRHAFDGTVCVPNVYRSVEEITRELQSMSVSGVRAGLRVHTWMHKAGVATYADMARRIISDAVHQDHVILYPVHKREQVQPAKRADWELRRALRARRAENEEHHSVHPASKTFIRPPSPVKQVARTARVLRKHERRTKDANVPRVVRQIRRDYGESYADYPQWGIPIRVSIGPDRNTVNIVHRLCEAVTSAVVAITGGSGPAGRMIRKALLAIVPAIVLMMAVKLLGKTVASVMALLGAGAFAFLGPFRGAFEKTIAQFGENGEAALVSKVCAVAALAYLFKKKVPTVVMAGMISRLPSFQIATMNLADWGASAVQWMFNSIRSMLGQEPILFWKRRSDQVTEWMDATIAMYKVPDAPQKDPEEVMRLHELGIDLARSFPESIEIRNVNRKLDELARAARPALKAMRAKRAEPMCIVLYGKPGIGKSLMVKRLAAAYLAYFHGSLMERSGNDPAPYMYTHDGGEFWNGFNEYMHKVMVLDDLGSKKTDRASESDLASLMSIINTVEYPLNMASLDDKGNTYFRSDYVIATTNHSYAQLENFAEKVLTNQTALKRRMHIFVEVKLKPEFVKNDRFDLTKSTSPEARSPHGAWMFDAEVESTGEKRSFDSLVELAKFVNQLAAKRSLLAKQEEQSACEFLNACSSSDDEVQAQGFGRAVFGFCGKTVVRAQADGIKMRKMPDGDVELEYEGTTIVGAEEVLLIARERRGWLGKIKEVSRWAASWLSEMPAWKRFLVSFAVGVVVRLIADAIVGCIKTFLVGGRAVVRTQGDLGDAEEPQLYTSFISALSSNMYRVSITRPERSTIGGINVLFVKSRFAIMPAHYLPIFRNHIAESPGSVCVFENGLGERFNMRVEDFGVELDFVTKADHGSMEDLIMLRLPSRREHRDITSRFRAANTWLNEGAGAEWFRLDEPGKLQKHDINVSNMVGLDYDSDRVDYDGQQRKYHIAVGYSYKLNCQSGDCGAILVSQARTKPDCIFGMHTAGNANGIGKAIRVTRDWLHSAVSKFIEVEDVTLPAVSVVSPPPDLVVPQSMREHVVGYTAVGSFSPLLGGNPMVPSRVNDWSDRTGLEVEMLRPSNTTASATLESLATHATYPELQTSHPAFLAAARDYLDRIGFDARGCAPLLGVAEAAEGTVAGRRFAPAINKKSSAGFPYQSRGFLVGRLFDVHGAVDVRTSTYQRYSQDCDVALSRAMMGLRTRNIFAVSPKPETRPIHKVLPRVIQAASKPYTINWRRLFWSLTEFFGNWKPTNECAIGMNPFEHWEELSSWLVGNSTEVIAGDYSGFDKTHEPVITDAIWQALSEKFDDDEYNRARAVLWKDANGPEVQFGRVIYKLPRGLPSGHPGTAVINSMYNSVLLTLAYTSILSGGTDEVPFGPGWERILPTFRHNVRLQVLGDDNIMTSRQPAFNELSIGPAMRRFGAKYTMDQKLNVAVAPFRELHEVTFIGRGFRITPEGIDPCLRLSSVLDMGKWLQKPGDDDDRWQVSVLESILAELSLHDEEVWHNIAPAAFNAWLETGYKVPTRAGAVVLSREYWRSRVKEVLGGYYE